MGVDCLSTKSFMYHNYLVVVVVVVLFSPKVSGWAGGWQEKVCLGCISETVRCRKLIVSRDIGCGV